MRHTLPICLALLFIAPACQLDDAVRIEGEDSRVFAPRVLAKFDQTSDGAAKRSSINVEVSQLTGEFDEEVSAGRNISVGDGAYLGPQTVAVEAELTEASVSWNQEFIARERFRFEGFLGLGALAMDTTLEGNEGIDSDDEFFLGPRVGAQGTFVLARDLALYGRFAVLAGLSGDGLGLGTAEVGLQWQLAGAVAIAAGWYTTTLERPEDDDALSDISLDFEGPFARLVLGGTR